MAASTPGGKRPFEPKSAPDRGRAEKEARLALRRILGAPGLGPALPLAAQASR